MPAHVDWEFAKSTGRTLVSPGPDVTPAEAAAEVAAIAAAARAAHAPVAETARLHTPADAPAALVVDRATWIAANTDALSALLGPAIEGLIAGSSGASGAAAGAAAAVGAKVTGAEVGGLLAFLASRVLGQYDLAPQATPQLLLVAPNVLAIRRELDVDPGDFRAWVCMHEETHRVQFTANPWLREHLIDSARHLAGGFAPDREALPELARQLAHRLPETFRAGGAGLADLFSTPEQRAELAQVTAVMSLLEGHADVVMDDVGPTHIPTVSQIRAKFTSRRRGGGALDQILRRILGLEAKTRQYRDGAAFVRAVQGQIGVDGFNAIWTSRETLPLPEEIADPSAWVRRVHG